MIYFVSGRPYVASFTNAKTPVIGAGHYQYQVFDNELCKLSNSDNEGIACNWFKIGGKAYRVINNAESYEYSSATEDNLYLVDKDGNKLDMPLEIVYLLKRTLPNKISPPYVAGLVRGYQEKRRSCLLLADFETKKLFCSENDLFLNNLVVLPDGVYGYDDRADSFKKYDFELNEAWAFKPENVIGTHTKKVIPCNDTILYYHGHVKIEQLESVEVPDDDVIHTNHIRLDGELYCLDRETGEMRWERKFPIAITDIVVHEDQLYCVAEKEIFRLSPETGEILDQAEMEFNTGGETHLNNLMNVVEGKLWITVNHWYYQTFCLLVVNPATLSIEHKIDTPAPYVPDKFLTYDAEKRQVYYGLSTTKYEPYLEHRDPLLVIDLDDLGKATEFETKPDIEIGFQPAADNEELEELWIHIKAAPLEKALRFGIVETQNQTALHSVCSIRKTNPRKTFNGRVHFRYSGSDRPKAEVDEVLRVIETSFNKWAEQMYIEAGNRSDEPVTIDVVYLAD